LEHLIWREINKNADFLGLISSLLALHHKFVIFSALFFFEGTLRSTANDQTSIIYERSGRLNVSLRMSLT